MYEVIVSKYSNGCAYEELYRHKHDNAKEAVETAKQHVGMGKSVLIRPSFNEVNGDMLYFREWMSANGNEFTLRYFDVPGLTPTDNDKKYSANQVEYLLGK